MKRKSVVGGKCDTIVMGGVDVVEDIQGGLHVTSGGLGIVGGEEGMRRGEVWTGALSEPTNASHKTLVGMLALEKGRTVIGFSRGRDSINGDDRPVGSGQRGR